MDIKIVLSLLAILTAAGVALFCDYRRTRDLRRREALVELRVRKEEEERKHSQAALSVATEAPPVQRQPRQNEAAKLAARVFVEPTPAGLASPVAEAPTLESKLNSKNKEEDMQPKQALSNWLVQRAIARAAERAAAEAGPVADSALPAEVPATTAAVPPFEEMATPEPPVIEPQPESAQVLLDAASPEPISQFEPVLVEPHPEPIAIPTLEDATPRPAAPAPTVSRFEPVVVDQFLWESLMRDSKSAPEPQFQVIQGSAGTQTELTVPAGVYEAEMLSRLTGSDRPFSGLVVSIGVSESDGRPNRDEHVLRDVRTLVEGLIRAEDCLCIRDDELILICPGQTGMDAQRRLGSLSENLWDYQLEAEGSSAVLSLGGIDVQREPLEQAVASATDRMLQTKRGRKAIMMPLPGQRRKAV